MPEDLRFLRGDLSDPPVGRVKDPDNYYSLIKGGKIMKKQLICAMLMGTIALCPVSAYADEKDDRIAELEATVSDLEKQVADLQEQLEAAQAKEPSSTSQDVYRIGETWVVEGQWKVTVDSVEETSDRNEYSDKTPEAVYIVTYTYENLGYESDFMDGLYVNLEDGIVDNAGKMGYSYPGDITLYPQETPVGAVCEAQACIGVDNPGSFQINFYQYDGNEEKQSAVFEIEVK